MRGQRQMCLRDRALIDTHKGQFLADLYEQETPVTVNNFVTLARNHYFDGIRFHRVIEGFMAQTGDPLSVDEAIGLEPGDGTPRWDVVELFPSEGATLAERLSVCVCVCVCSLVCLCVCFSVLLFVVWCG